MGNEKNSKQLIKGVGIYAIGTFGTKILSFLIVPLYTYYIVTSDMGIYDILISTINLLTPIITMQISDAAYRWIIRADEKSKAIYICATIQVLLINCTLAMLLIFLTNYFYAIPYCTYFCVILVLSRTFQTMQKLLRGLKKQWLFAISGLIYTIVFLSLNVLQLCVLKRGLESLFQSAIAANVVAILVIIIFEPQFRINYISRPDHKLIYEMYRYSVPLVPNYLNWWVINSSDILFCLLWEVLQMEYLLLPINFQQCYKQSWGCLIIHGRIKLLLIRMLILGNIIQRYLGSFICLPCPVCCS